jgi:hypothetical protein
MTTISAASGPGPGLLFTAAVAAMLEEVLYLHSSAPEKDTA